MLSYSFSKRYKEKEGGREGGMEGEIDDVNNDYPTISQMRKHVQNVGNLPKVTQSWQRVRL